MGDVQQEQPLCLWNPVPAKVFASVWYVPVSLNIIFAGAAGEHSSWVSRGFLKE